MSNTNQSFQNPQDLISYKKSQNDKIDIESDFQSNNDQDQQQLFHHQSFKKQKKSNFNPLLWTQEDQQKLIHLHKQIGNKWTNLSKYFHGSDQNSIKNHFYSRLRKSIRKLNKNISTLFGKKYSKFNLNIIFKISNASQGKIMGKCQVETSIKQFYKDFIYKLIDFSNKDQENDQDQKVDLIEQIQNFTLALIALQNLFRIVSGERVYKGKKKNIAYLKRFNFKLDNQGAKTLVISKQNCYITDGPVNFDSQSEKSSQNYISIADADLQRESSIEQTVIQRQERVDEKKTHGCKINFNSNSTCESLFYTTETQSPVSPYQSCFLDDQLKQYELAMTSDKGKWFDNLLDEYSGNKFHFDIEC